MTHLLQRRKIVRPLLKDLRKNRDASHHNILRLRRAAQALQEGAQHLIHLLERIEHAVLCRSKTLIPSHKSKALKHAHAPTLREMHRSLHSIAWGQSPRSSHNNAAAA